MCEDVRFFICKHCGNIIGMIHSAGPAVVCCGEPMGEMVANTTEASVEKHVPVVTVDGCNVTVTVGSVAHPMTAEHHIAWVYLITSNGRQRKCLAFEADPTVSYCLADGEKPIAAYAYCNLHGLWKVDVK